MESNRLIAEFMELPTQVFKSGNVNYYFREFNSGSWYEEHELSYNESWDWLMPVIEKIYKERGLDDEIVLMIRDSVAELNIESTYKFIVEFIKEHNN